MFAYNETPSSSVRLNLVAQRTHAIQQSAICEMTRLSEAKQAINLGEGLPDFAPDALIQAQVMEALQSDSLLHQQQNTWGRASLREALATWYGQRYQLTLDPDKHITATVGASEGLYVALAAVTNPGDEIIVLEPFFESYKTIFHLLEVTPVYITLPFPTFELDVEQVKAVLTPRTKALLLNTPNNPTGSVLSLETLTALAQLAQQHQFYIISDEVYSELTYDGHAHTPMATLEGMDSWAITTSSVSKNYSATGWRVGWVIANATVTDAIRKVHDVTTAGTNGYFQEATARVLALPPSYYDGLRADYHHRRDAMEALLRALGFNPIRPQGAYYFWTDTEPLRHLGHDDLSVVKGLIEQYGISNVPGRCFFRANAAEAGVSTHYLRWCFAKKLSTLHTAMDWVQASNGK
ncbi:MAG: pyridoxal phosphate-dependent aminotransferase [Vampirovibrionales bacterium]